MKTLVNPYNEKTDLITGSLPQIRRGSRDNLGIAPYCWHGYVLLSAEVWGGVGGGGGGGGGGGTLL